MKIKMLVSQVTVIAVDFHQEGAPGETKVMLSCLNPATGDSLSVRVDADSDLAAVQPHDDIDVTVTSPKAAAAKKAAAPKRSRSLAKKKR